MKDKFLVFLYVAVTSVIILTGCNKEDGDNNPLGGNSNGTGLVGTWKLTEATLYPGTDSSQVLNQTTLALAGLAMTLAANENGSYTMTTTTPDSTSTETGTWAISGNNITITPEGESPVTVPYSIENNVLTISLGELEFDGDSFPVLLRFARQG